MWNFRTKRTAQLLVSLFLSLCFVLESSPLMAGPDPARQHETAIRSQFERPPLSPGYLPDQSGKEQPDQPAVDLPPALPAADAPDMSRIFLPMVSNSSGNAQVEASALFTGEVVLSTGWNLISLPEEPANKNVDSVLTPIGGSYDKVFTYQACDAVDPWKEYDPANLTASDLSQVDHTLGIWVRMTQAGDLDVDGSKHLSTTIHLCAGWNLIGYPLATPQLLSTALASLAGKYSRVIGYDALDTGSTPPDPWEVNNIASPTWANDLTVLQPGHGYWIYATQDANLTFAEPPLFDVLPPTVVVSATPSLVNVGQAVLLALQVADNAVVASQELRVNDTPVTLDRGGQAWYTPTVAGLYTVIGKAEDGVGNSSSDTAYFSARSSSNNGPPTALLTSPANDTIISATINLIGTASDSDLVFYTLEAKPADGTTFSEFARGFAAVVNGTLGTFSPGLFAAGMVDVRVCAEDSWGTRTCSPANRYDFGSSAPLPGAMRFGALDAELTASGIPLRINRLYDSRLKSSSDFGIGWRMETNEVRLYANRLLGNDWQQVFFAGVPVAYGLQATADHRVTVVLPNGTIHRFRLKPKPETQPAARITTLTGATFEPLSNTTSSLVAVELPAFVDSGTPTLNNPSPALLLDAAFNIYSPTNYRLTLNDGTRLDFVRNGALNVLTYRLSKITDTNGNTVTITSGGITHSAGIGFTITRDAKGRVTVIKNPKGDSRSYSYDAKGRLISSKDWDGYETKYGYDAADNLISVTDARGFTPGSFVYDENGQIVAIIDSDGNRTQVQRNQITGEEVVTDSNGRTTRTQYDERGRPIQVTDALGGVTRFSYDERDNLLSKIDPLGNITSYSYDARNNQLSQTDALGQTTRYSYDSNNHRLSQTDALSRTTRYEYDSKGNLLSVTDALGQVSERNTYDAKGNVVATSNAISATTRFQYDSAGRRTVITDTLGNVERYVYNANGQMTGTTDKHGITTTITLDKRGNFVQMLNGLGTLARFNWDARGSLSQVTDPSGQSTRTVYDEKGRAIQEVDLDGRSANREFDAYNNLIQATDGAGRTTTNTYDALNRLIKSVAPDGGATNKLYDALGRPIQTTDARGNQTQIEYDALGRSVRITDSLGSVTRFGYDAVGNLINVVDPAGRSFTTRYDELNRVIEQSFPDGKSIHMSYDLAGRVGSMTDELNRVTRYEYDLLNHLNKVIDPSGGETTYTYNAEGQLLTQTDANQHTTRFAYDRAGRRIRTTYPDGSTIQVGYDALGRTSVMTDAIGTVIRFQYDTYHRLTAKIYPDNTRISFGYNPLGQLITVTDARGVTTYGYDLLGRVTSIDNPDGSALRYSFDTLGNRTAVTAKISPSAAALTIRYAYDALNRLQSITDSAGAVTTYLYDNNGNRTRVNYGNGSYTRYSYDTRNRLIAVEQGKGTTVYARFSYALDAVGDRTRVDQLDGSYTIYQYDTLRRLLRETQYSPSNVKTLDLAYSYDAVGNRTNQSDLLASKATNYSYDSADKLLASSDATYSYDANGNLIQQVSGGVTTHYTYDYDQRLIQVQTSTGSVTTYSYDPQRNRIGRNGSNGNIRYLVDPQDNSGLPQVLAEYSGSSLLVNYVYGDDLISQRRGGVVSYYHYDGSNNTRLLTNAAGTVTDRYTFDAYGRLIGTVGSTVNSYLYSGEQFDPNSGFYYLRARTYSPDTGRFTSRDPIHGDTQTPISLHKYLYANANPVYYGDPSGKFSFVQTVMVSAIINGLITFSTQMMLGKSWQDSLIKAIVDAGIGAVVGAAAEGLLLAKGGTWLVTKLIRFGPGFMRYVKAFALAIADTISAVVADYSLSAIEDQEYQPNFWNYSLVFLSSFLLNALFIGSTRSSAHEFQQEFLSILTDAEQAAFQEMGHAAGTDNIFQAFILVSTGATSIFNRHGVVVTDIANGYAEHLSGLIAKEIFDAGDSGFVDFLWNYFKEFIKLGVCLGVSHKTEQVSDCDSADSGQ